MLTSCSGHIDFLLFKVVARFGCIKNVEKIVTKPFAVRPTMWSGCKELRYKEKHSILCQRVQGKVEIACVVDGNIYVDD